MKFATLTEAIEQRRMDDFYLDVAVIAPDSYNFQWELEDYLDKSTQDDRLYKVLLDIKKQLSKEYPDIVEPKNKGFYYRGRRIKFDEMKSIYDPNVKSGSKWVKGVYKPRVKVQSWTSDYRTADKFTRIGYDQRTKLQTRGTVNYYDYDWDTSVDYYIKGVEGSDNGRGGGSPLWRVFWSLGQDRALMHAISASARDKLGALVFPSVIRAKIPDSQMIFHPEVIDPHLVRDEKETLRISSKPLKVEYEVDSEYVNFLKVLKAALDWMVKNYDELKANNSTRTLGIDLSGHITAYTKREMIKAQRDLSWIRR